MMYMIACFLSERGPDAIPSKGLSVIMNGIRVRFASKESPEKGSRR